MNVFYEWREKKARIAVYDKIKVFTFSVSGNVHCLFYFSSTLRFIIFFIIIINIFLAFQLLFSNYALVERVHVVLALGEESADSTF